MKYSADNKIALKFVAVSVAMMMVVSCVMPCIAVDGLKDNAATDETLLGKAVDNEMMLHSRLVALFFP